MWWFWEKPWNRCILLHVVHTIFVHLCFLSRFSYASEWKLLISVTNFDVILSSLYVTLSTQDFISIFCNFVICPVWFRIISVIFFLPLKKCIWASKIYFKFICQHRTIFHGFWRACVLVNANVFCFLTVPNSQ